MFGIKCRFQQCKAWSPRFKESSVPAHQICVPPWKSAIYLLLSTNLAREWLQIDTDLLRTMAITANGLFGGTDIDDLERPWTRKIWALSEFFAILGCDAHLHVNFRWNILEIDQDNLRTKLNWCCRVSREHSLRFLVGVCNKLTINFERCNTIKVSSFVFDEFPKAPHACELIWVRLLRCYNFIYVSPLPSTPVTSSQKLR